MLGGGYYLDHFILHGDHSLGTEDCTRGALSNGTRFRIG